MEGLAQIEKILVVSIAHVTEAESKALDAGNHAYLPMFIRDEGWMFHTECHVNPDAADDSVSDSMRQCFQRADALGCAWLMFDCDADALDDIPTHDW